MEKHISKDEEDDEEGDAEYKDVVVMLFEFQNGCKFVRMSRGSETRWWSIGESAQNMLKTLPMRRFMARNFDDMKANREDSKAKKIAQDFLSISAEPVILCDAAYLMCFHRFYLAGHMKFFQSLDKLTRAAGCQPFSIFVRCYLMTEDYKAMGNGGWKNLTDFQELVTRLSQCSPGEEYAMEVDKIEKSFEMARQENLKLFARWKDINKLAVLASFSEKETGMIVCSRILGRTQEDYTPTMIFFSENHGRSINLAKFVKYVEQCFESCQVENLPHHVDFNLQSIIKIAEELDIWNRNYDKGNPDNDSRQTRLAALEGYGALLTNNQGTERANRSVNQSCGSVERIEDVWTAQ
jgi:hypothetical protein